MPSLVLNYTIRLKALGFQADHIFKLEVNVLFYDKLQYFLNNTKLNHFWGYFIYINIIIVQ